MTNFEKMQEKYIKDCERYNDLYNRLFGSLDDQDRLDLLCLVNSEIHSLESMFHFKYQFKW